MLESVGQNCAMRGIFGPRSLPALFLLTRLDPYFLLACRIVLGCLCVGLLACWIVLGLTLFWVLLSCVESQI